MAINNNLSSPLPPTEYANMPPLTSLKEERDELSGTEYEGSGRQQSMDHDNNMETSVWTDRQSRDVWNNSPQPSPPQSDREIHVWNSHLKKTGISQEAAD